MNKEQNLLNEIAKDVINRLATESTDTLNTKVNGIVKEKCLEFGYNPDKLVFEYAMFGNDFKVVGENDPAKQIFTNASCVGLTINIKAQTYEFDNI